MSTLQQRVTGWSLGLLLASALLSITGNDLAAEEIYKVVDEEGNITYTTEPPDEGKAAQVIDTLPEPSEEEIRAARERQEKISEDLEARSEARAEEARAQAERDNSSSTTIITSPGVIPVPVYYPGYHRPSYRPRPPHGRPPHRPGNRPRPVPY